MVYPLDIYFVDDYGNKVEVTSNFTVTVKIPENLHFENPAIYYVATNGKVTLVESTKNGNYITFTTNHNSYYVLTEKIPENKGNADKPNDKSDTRSPQTGDTSNLALWIFLLCISGAALTVTNLYGRKKRTTR